MIVSMLKYTFLVYHADYAEFLQKIKEMELLHPIEKANRTIDESLLEDAARYKNIIRIFEQQLGGKEIDTTKRMEGKAILQKYDSLKREKEDLSQQLGYLQKDVEKLYPWGYFDLETIEKIQAAGVVLEFYSCAQRDFNNKWNEDYFLFEQATIASTVYFVLVSPEGSTSDLDAERHIFSSETLNSLEKKCENIQEEINKIDEKIDLLIEDSLHSLRFAYEELMDEIALSKVIANTDPAVEEKVRVLEAWCPEDKVAELNSFADEKNMLYITAEPSLEENVPIKLKNNRFARLFEFIGELYDLPNYHERDLTPFFAPFYLLFFGLCLGDAGYGLVFILGGLLARRKMENPVYKSVMTLAVWLGGATVLMGIVSGTFFGYSLIDSQIPWLQSFKAVMLDSNKLFYNALILGVIQILFGMVVKFIGQIKRFGFLSAISTLGWLFLLLGCGGTYVLSAFAGLDSEMAKWMYIIFGILGLGCVLILNDVKRNPLFNLGSGLWDSYNMITGILGDVLSYIRIFALGLSGGVMGLVFNDLAINMSGDIPVLSTIIMVLIMLVGHSINIFINGIGAFVHPMRLTFVEFYKNAGFQGGGKKYKPFAKYKEETKVL